MEFNETLRRTVGGHRRVLVLFIVLPILVVGALEFGTARTYVSRARVQASATLPQTDVQANAMLSRVKAVATSGSVIKPALKQTHVTDRTQGRVAREIRVSRLGGSSVFNIEVTDRDPRTAEKLAGAVSEQLVHFFNGTGNVLVTQLTDRENTLQEQRTRIAAELPQATSASRSGQLTARLGALDQQILDVQSSLRAAQAAGLGDRTASLLSSASDAVRLPALSAPGLVLAGAVGLVAGLLVVSLLEVLRPHVPGQGAFAREFDAPVLGRLPKPARGDPEGTEIDAESVVAVHRAAARAGAGTVVLTGPGGEQRLDRLARALQTRLTNVRGQGGTGPAASGDGADEPYPVAPRAGGDRGRERAEWLWPAPGHAATALADGRVAEQHRVARDAARTLRVRALHEVDDAGDPTPHVLVPVEPDLAPQAELGRVRNLVATTGWPVIGVLGDPVRRHGDGADRTGRV